MEIANLLVHPALRQLDQEFSALAQQMSGRPDLEVQQFLLDIQGKRNQIQAFYEIFSNQSAAPSEASYERLRELKLDYRFMHRRWLKILSNFERLKKMESRRVDVAAVAA